MGYGSIKCKCNKTPKSSDLIVINNNYICKHCATHIRTKNNKIVNYLWHEGELVFVEFWERHMQVVDTINVRELVI